jgi:hypothetical protein
MTSVFITDYNEVCITPHDMLLWDINLHSRELSYWWNLWEGRQFSNTADSQAARNADLVLTPPASKITLCITCHISLWVSVDRDSSVGTGTGYGTNVQSSNPGRNCDFSVRHYTECPTQLCDLK